MPEMQKVHADGHSIAGEGAAGAPRGLFESPGALIWQRRDWPRALGSLDSLRSELRRSQVQQRWFDWTLVEIPELKLERGAALLLLQGQSLSQLLIPNHEILDPQGRAYQIAHLILRVDPWEAWRAPPRLTRLVLAKLGVLPPGISPTELLATLAHESAPA